MTQSTERYLSTKETAELIGRSISSVHAYVQDGTLHPVKDPWGGHTGLLFSIEEVERFLDTMPKAPSGLTLNQAAALLETNRNFVSSYIKEGILPATEETVRGRRIWLVQEAAIHEFRERYRKRLRQDRLMQRQFYNKKTKEAAYQRFSSSLIQEARLMRDGLGDWYFRIRDSGDTVSYMEGVYTYRLTRDYPVTTGKRSTKPGYAILNVPADYSLTYAFMDLVYQQVPVENVYMEMLDNRLLLHMKDASLRDVPDELARFLQQSVKQGRVRYARDHQAVRIETEEELLSVTLPVHVKDWLRHKSEASGKSMQDVAAEMLGALFEQERQEGY